MSAGRIIALLVLGLIVIGGGVFVVMKALEKSQQPTIPAQEQMIESEVKSLNEDVADLSGLAEDEDVSSIGEELSVLTDEDTAEVVAIESQLSDEMSALNSELTDLESLINDETSLNIDQQLGSF